MTAKKTAGQSSAKKPGKSAPLSDAALDKVTGGGGGAPPPRGPAPRGG